MNHLLLIMRTAIILLFTCVFISVAETGHSQSAKVSLNKNNVNLKEVLNEIENQTDYLFIYNNQVNTDKTVSVNTDNTTVRKVLTHVLKDSDIDFSMEGNHIILSYIEKQLNEKNEENTETVQQQGKTITGTIVDEQGEPIIGANIIEKGTSNGTVTDFDGKFSLNVRDNAILRISYIGYLEQEINTANKTSFNIVLQDDTKALDELVVVGYGSVSKRELTSAVSSVNSEDFIQGAFTSPLSMIDGKVSGVSISNPAAADPNAQPNVQMRGASSLEAGNSPLIIVDGMPGVNLGNIANQDIESMTILKDGSAAAIYGSRAANGVILIETKKGQKGEVSISYEGYMDHDIVANKPNVLSAEEFIENKRDNDFGYKNNWYDLLINKDNIGQSHYVAISGGGENLSFRTSVNYKTKEGIDLTSNRKELGARMGFNSNLFNNKLEISGNLSTRSVNEEYANYDIFNQAIKLNPTHPLMNPENPDKYSILYGYDTYNPVGMVKNMENGGDREFSMLDFKVKLNILPRLNTELSLARQNQEYVNSIYVNSDHKESIDNMRKGRATLRKENWTDYTLEWIGNYFTEINNHTFKLMGGYSYQEFNHSSFQAENADFPSDMLLYNNLGAGDWNRAEGRLGMSSYKDKEKTIGFPMRLTYSYDDTYFINASVRYEGNTKFGTNNKWGWFPAASAAWRLSELSFVDDTDIVDDLKIRASYGETGRSGFAKYSALSRYGASGYYPNNTGQWTQSWGPANNPNPNLHWEKQTSYNLGLDFDLFNNKLSGSFDLFIKQGKDVISFYDAPVPPFIFDQIFTNVASTKSKGVELSLDWDVVNNKNFTYTTSIVTSYTKSILDKFSDEVYQKGYMDRFYLPAPGNPGHAQRLKDGTEIGTFWGFKYAGVDDNGNMLVWKNAEVGSEKILASGEASDLDQGPLGNGAPRYLLSWNNKLRYKNFDLSLYFQGRFDYKILNMYQMYYGLTSEPGINILKDAYGKNSEIKSAKVMSDYFLENGDYFKLDNITLGWSPNLKTQWITNLRIYGTMRNVFTLTNYSVMSPSSVETNGLNPGVSGLNVYPIARSITLGVQITY